MPMPHNTPRFDKSNIDTLEKKEIHTSYFSLEGKQTTYVLLKYDTEKKIVRQMH